MKFACLVYIDPAIISTLSPEAGRALTDATIEGDWQLRNSGHLILAQPLAAPETAITVRVRDGHSSSTDGPFAETKEFLGGFFLIEAADQAKALEIANLCPMAAYGSIELRPFLDQTHSQTGAARPDLKP
jgi:hypothetical protein